MRTTKRVSAWDPLWTLVSWELPNDTRSAKNAAERFKRKLRKLTFGNESIGKEGMLLVPQKMSSVKSLLGAIPPDSKLSLVAITDKQIEKSEIIWGATR